MKPYPKYRDSGVPWLNNIPEHWAVRKIKFIFREREERNIECEFELLSFSRSKGLIPYSVLNRRPPSSSDLSNYKVCRIGNLLMNRMQAWSGMFTGVSIEGVVSPDYSVFDVIDKDSTAVYYFSLLFKTPLWVAVFANASKGVGDGFNRLYTPAFGAIQALFPPVLEQIQITRFLGWKTSKINKFIKAKKKLIALLKEQKQNIINEAVTKGVNSDVKMKDSGVEWLGEIPAHWEVRKFKHFSRFYSGGTPSKAIDSFWKGDIPWVSPKDMKTKYIFDSCDHISREAVEGSSTSYVDKGQMLMVVRSGILRRTIPVCIAQKKLTFNQDIRAIALDDKFVSVEYFYLFIIGCEKKLLDKWLKVGATVESIEYEYMANSYLPIPPMVEQNSTVDYIEKETALIDKTITRTEREIELIQEYRIRLVSDVVTGKVDVRSVEIPKFEFYPLLVEEFERRLGDEEEILGEGGEE